MSDKKIRSVAKTFSWRLLIFIYWVIFGYIYTGTFIGAGILGVGSITDGAAASLDKKLGVNFIFTSVLR